MINKCSRCGRNHNDHWIWLKSIPKDVFCSIYGKGPNSFNSCDICLRTSILPFPLTEFYSV